jgi:hypothetical protein
LNFPPTLNDSTLHDLDDWIRLHSLKSGDAEMVLGEWSTFQDDLYVQMWSPWHILTGEAIERDM